MASVLEALQREADALLAAGDYTHALPEFRVLAEMRSRQDGPYSVRYLANLHDAVRCLSRLRQWPECEPLSAELYGKYRRTHGPGESSTVDAAKHYAWAMVHLDKRAPAASVYLVTADALWERGDRDDALAMLGAAVAALTHDRAHGTSVSIDDAIRTGRVRHLTELTTAAAELANHMPPEAGWLTVEGYRRPGEVGQHRSTETPRRST